MKHRELIDHIQGSFLKRQFLESFLVQSAYIESLLKIYADYSYFIATGKKTDNKILNVVSGNIDKFSLNDLVKFLYKADLISQEQRDLLNIYRDRRNRMLHNLIKEIQNNDFEKELKEICEKGNEIIESKEILEIAELVDYIELPQDEDLGKSDLSSAS